MNGETFDQQSAPVGLTSDQARRRAGEFGPNSVADETPPRWSTFLGKLWGPIPWMLELALVIQMVRGAYVEALVIAGLLLFNATLGFAQEARANSALSALMQRLAPTALVRRDGAWIRIPASGLVPGDAIRLPLGALVPADARIASGAVMVDQSALTGESVPVDAGPGTTVYAGSLIRRGQALGEVTATGTRTYSGRAAELVHIARAASTEQAAILSVTRNLALVNGSVAALIIGYAFVVGLPPAEIIGLALTALLATIPVALPATFTVSAALGARALARKGVLVTRLSAAHEAAAMDVLCVDKTGTLTRNALDVVDVIAMPELDRDRVLALAAMASSEGDQDPIDAAIRAAATQAPKLGAAGRVVRFTPFDPATKTSDADIIDGTGHELRVAKGGFGAIAGSAQAPADARQRVDDLASRGYRVIAVAAGTAGALRLAGLIAISDAAREDSAALIATLRSLGVRTVMVTGDSPITAAAIAREVGITGPIAPADGIADELSADAFGVFARVVPEAKYRLVKALQRHGHVVGMCGDGTNDGPALRQAQIGIAVATATDVAKASAGVVLTAPGLAGIVSAVHEGRVAFQRLFAYTLNMLVKKIEIVLFLAIGLVLTGRAVMTPVLMVLMMVTNDFLSMSLTTDRAHAAPAPSVWRTRNIIGAAIVLGLSKLAFSTSVLAFGSFRQRLDAPALQTLAFVTLVFGNQALLYVVRERRHLWSSAPSAWVLLSSGVDVAIVSTLALSGTLMAPLSLGIVTGVFAAAVGFALILDQIKGPVMTAFTVR